MYNSILFEYCFRLIPEHLEWMKSVITSPFKLLVSTESKHDYDIQGQVTSRTEAIKLYCFTLEKLDQLGLQNALVSYPIWGSSVQAVIIKCTSR